MKLLLLILFTLFSSTVFCQPSEAESKRLDSLVGIIANTSNEFSIIHDTAQVVDPINPNIVKALIITNYYFDSLHNLKKVDNDDRFRKTFETYYYHDSLLLKVVLKETKAKITKAFFYGAKDNQITLKEANALKWKGENRMYYEQYDRGKFYLSRFNKYLK